MPFLGELETISFDIRVFAEPDAIQEFIELLRTHVDTFSVPPVTEARGGYERPWHRIMFAVPRTCTITVEIIQCWLGQSALRGALVTRYVNRRT